MKFSLFTLFLLLPYLILCQSGEESQDTLLKGYIQVDVTPLGGGKYQIDIDTTNAPLTPKSGGKTPYYDYWIETGDGHLYREKSFVHQYASSGDYEIFAMAVNRYDDGVKPDESSASLGKDDSGMGVYQPTGLNTKSYFPSDRENASIYLAKSSDAKPDETMGFMLVYKNPMDTIVSGQLAILFNENRFNKTLFEEGQVRAHHGEKIVYMEQSDYPLGLNSSYYEQELFEDIATNYKENEILVSVEADYFDVKSVRPFVEQVSNKVDSTQNYLASRNMNSVLDTAMNTFADKIVLSFDNLKPGEERNLFFSLCNTPEMWKDTNVTVNMLGVYTDDRGNVSEYPLEIAIVAAHDPNKVSVNDRKVRFRGFQNRKLIYKIKFQNEGKGEADRVRIKIPAPKGVDWNDYEVIVKEMKPLTPMEGDKNPKTSSRFKAITTPDSIVFIFDGIALYGLNQKGITDKESTKGYVKFEIKPKNRIKRQPIEMLAAIKFDKEDDIYTNKATTRFKGTSIGLKGEILDFKVDSILNSDFSRVGFTISPFKKERSYFQGEIMFSKPNKGEFLDTIPVNEIDPRLSAPINEFGRLGDWKEVLVNPTTSLAESLVANRITNNIIIDLAIQYRKDIFPFLGIGVGAHMIMDINIVNDLRSDTILINRVEEYIGYKKQGTRTNNLRPSVFADINIGLVKQGPSLGLRYHRVLEQGQSVSFWRAYALMKF